jgi:hypothetical protein
MKTRGFLALLVAAMLATACGGAPTGIPAADPYRFNPGEADPRPPIGGA